MATRRRTAARNARGRTSQQRVEKLYQLAKKADDAFQAALVKEYGKRAGDMRYQTAKQTPRIKALGKRMSALADRWREAYRAESSKNPKGWRVHYKRPDEKSYLFFRDAMSAEAAERIIENFKAQGYQTKLETSNAKKCRTRSNPEKAVLVMDFIKEARKQKVVDDSGARTLEMAARRHSMFFDEVVELTADAVRRSESGAATGQDIADAYRAKFPQQDSEAEQIRRIDTILSLDTPNATAEEIRAAIGKMKSNPSSQLGQVAFEAGKHYSTSGDYDTSGVANARVVAYGFSKWWNNQSPASLKGEKKSRLLKSFREGFAAGKRSKRNAGPYSFRKTKKTLARAGTKMKSSKRQKHTLRAGSRGSDAARTVVDSLRGKPLPPDRGGEFRNPKAFKSEALAKRYADKLKKTGWPDARYFQEEGRWYVKYGSNRNPKALATLTQGKSKAEITAAPRGGFDIVVTGSRGTQKHHVDKFKTAMAWSRLRLHEIALPNGVSVRAYPLTKRGKRNPLDKAAKLFEVFHGYPSKEVLEYVEQEHRHSALAGIGPLVSLHVMNLDGDKVIEINAPDPGSAAERVVMTCATEDGCQLELVGGDQKLSIEGLKKEFGMTDQDVKDRMLIGTIVQLTYRTRKSFEEDGKVEIDFYHDLGEVSGVMPVLIYKPRNPSMEIAGGRYFIGPPSDDLGGVSPGIED